MKLNEMYKNEIEKIAFIKQILNTTKKFFPRTKQLTFDTKNYFKYNQKLPKNSIFNAKKYSEYGKNYSTGKVGKDGFIRRSIDNKIIDRVQQPGDKIKNIFNKGKSMIYQNPKYVIKTQKFINDNIQPGPNIIEGIKTIGAGAGALGATGAGIASISN